jgi:hypothetical protein
LRRAVRMSTNLHVKVLLFCCLALVACGAVENAAAKDPQKCERDPSCAAKHANSADCSTQCADNMDCMKTCEQIQGHR